MEKNIVTQEPIIPWMTDDIRRDLATEVPAYKSIVEEVTDPDLNIPQFWRLVEKKIPTWAACAKKIALLQPSSAAIERVWSMFSNFFEPGSENSPLIDYINAFLMVRYNTRSKKGDSDCTI